MGTCIYFFCLFACFLSLPVCAQENIRTVHIDLQSGFDGSKVTVEVNGQKEFDKEAKSNPVTGLAGRFTYSTKSDVIHVKINCMGPEYTTDLKLKDGLYVGIRVREG